MGKFDNEMMETAIIWAKRSYCKRRQVGAILSRDGRIVSNGYNGAVSGANNDCEDKGESVKYCSRCGCKDQSLLEFEEDNSTPGNSCMSCNHIGVVREKDMLITKSSVIHAEANAILFAAKNGINTDGCLLYVTLSPCIECAKMIITSGIKEVIFLTKYRVTDGIEFLEQNNIIVRELNLSNTDSNFLRTNNITVDS